MKTVQHAHATQTDGSLGVAALFASPDAFEPRRRRSHGIVSWSEGECAEPPAAAAAKHLRDEARLFVDRFG